MPEADQSNTYLVPVSRWDEMEPALREQAYQAIENDPEYLFEHDGGPYGIRADVIFARLYGFDDQIVRDGWRLSRIEPDLRLPIPRRIRLTEPDDTALLMPKIALYVLQSAYAVQTVDAVYGPPDVPIPPDFQIRVLYLRYRRRS